MSLPSLPPDIPSVLQAEELLFQAVQDNFAVTFASTGIAATTWIAYDIILAFPQEVELVWESRWTLPKMLYIAVRYYGLFASGMYTGIGLSFTVPLGLCRFWTWFEIFGTADLVFLLSEGMFLLRLWSCYERNKQILALVVICWLAEIGVSLAVGIVEGRNVHFTVRPSGFPIGGCYAEEVDVPLDHTLAGWIIYCLIGTTYLVLMIYRCLTSPAFKLQMFHARRDPIFRLFELRRLSPFVYLLVRDGLAYFAMMFVVVVLNMALSIHFNGRIIEQMGIAWIIAVSSVSSSRLFLNLRGFRGTPAGSLMTYGSSMKFELNPSALKRGDSRGRGQGDITLVTVATSSRTHSETVQMS